jgi:hypothetical protein
MVKSTHVCMGWMHVIHIHAGAEHMCANAIDAVSFYFGQAHILHFAWRRVCMLGSSK